MRQHATPPRGCTHLAPPTAHLRLIIMADQTRNDEDPSDSVRLPCHTARGTSDEDQDPPPSSKKRSFEKCDDDGDELALREPRTKHPCTESPSRSDTPTTTISDEVREGDRPANMYTMLSEKLPLSPGARTDIQGTTAGSLPSTVGNAERPLSSADIAKFEEDGFIMLRGAFGAEVASACR